MIIGLVAALTANFTFPCLQEHSDIVLRVCAQVHVKLLRGKLRLDARCLSVARGDAPFASERSVAVRTELCAVLGHKMLNQRIHTVDDVEYRHAA